MIDIQQLQSKNVLVIGDIILDSFWNTKTTGKSPEADVDVWKLNKVIDTPGGAGNVAWNIQSLKSNPILLGVIGDDASGKRLLDTLEQLGINTNYILEEEDRLTTNKIRVQNNDLLQHRIDQEQTNTIDEAIQKELLESLDEILEHQKIDVAILQDYNKGVLFSKNIPVIINKLQEHYIPIVVDPKFDNFNAYKGVDLFKPNWKEFSTSTKITDIEELPEISQKFIREHHIKNILITLSEKGSFYLNKEDHGIAETVVVKDADVCGAGDTVITVAALGLSNKWTLPEITNFANLCAGKVCQKKGVRPITMADLLLIS